MKNTIKMIGFAVIIAAIVFSMAGCVVEEPEDEGPYPLNGTITISPSTDVITGTELTATYSGYEDVSYQWKKGDANVGTNVNKYTPTEAGSYTVTVSAEGYLPKTSAAVNVTAPLPTLEGTWVTEVNEYFTMEMKLNNGSFEVTVISLTNDARMPDHRGTYTTNNGKITLTKTHVYGGGLSGGLAFNLQMTMYLTGAVSLDLETWYTKVEIKTIVDAATPGNALHPELTAEEAYAAVIETLDSLFQESTSGYTLSGNTLTLTSEDEDGEITTQIYTRLETFSSIASLNTWLSAQPSNTAATAYAVWLNVANFGGASNASGTVGKTLIDNRRYVSLNLSGSTFTQIANNAFEQCEYLTGVTIGNGVTSIGESAFSYCINLTGVTIGNKVASIGDNAFENCDSLTSITIPNSVKDIGISAFENCDALTSVTLPDNEDFEIIYGRTFYGCGGLASITIPDSVKSIGNSAFYGCASLTSVTIPSSVTGIDPLAFSGCINLTSVKFEGSVSSWSANSSNAFYGDLRDKFATAGTGGPGTYTTDSPVGANSVWTKKP